MSNVVFLKNLAFKSSERDIRDFFHFHKLDSISQIELVKKGSKTIAAYVEFSKFIDFQAALDLRSGRMHQRDFSILRSDRPITHKKREYAARSNTPEKDKDEPELPLSNDDFRKMLGSD